MKRFNRNLVRHAKSSWVGLCSGIPDSQANAVRGYGPVITKIGHDRIWSGDC